MSTNGVGESSYEGNVKTPGQWTKFSSCGSYSGGKLPECHVSWRTSQTIIAVIN